MIADLFVQDASAVINAGSSGASVTAGDTIATLVGSVYTDQLRRDWVHDRVSVYLAETRIDEQIPYLRSQFAGSFPEVAADFEHILAGYQSGPPETKYQELISFRSMFFLKLVETSARAAKYGGHDREEMARVFICHPSPCQNPTEVNRIAKSFRELWKMLSDQDSAGLSAKMGSVTAPYVDLMFRACVEVAAAVLRARETQRGSTPSP